MQEASSNAGGVVAAGVCRGTEHKTTSNKAPKLTEVESNVCAAYTENLYRQPS